jgi:phospholipase/carboxylesterase
VAVMLPRAPRNVWYDAMASEPRSALTEEQLDESLAAIDAAVGQIRSEGAAGAPLLMVGFSQGACLLIEWTLSRGPWDGALAALTGSRVGVPARDAAQRLDGLPAYLTGADADPFVGAGAFGIAAGALTAAGARLLAEGFPGRPHEAAPPEKARLAAMAAALTAGRDPLT